MHDIIESSRPNFFDESHLHRSSYLLEKGTVESHGSLFLFVLIPLPSKSTASKSLPNTHTIVYLIFGETPTPSEPPDLPKPRRYDMETVRYPHSMVAASPLSRDHL